MNSKETLKRIEKRAYNMSQKDGLFELFTGLVFIGIFLSQILSGLSINRPLNLLIPILPVCLIYWVLKKRLIDPRKGVVRFGPARKLKLKRFLYFELVFIVLQLLVLLFLKLGLLNMDIHNEFVIACLLSLILVFVPLSLIAFFKDYWPAYLVAIISSLIWPATVFMANYMDIDNCIKYIFLIPGLIFTTFGIIGLIIFLLENSKTNNPNFI